MEHFKVDIDIYIERYNKTDRYITGNTERETEIENMNFIF